MSSNIMLGIFYFQQKLLSFFADSTTLPNRTILPISLYATVGVALLGTNKFFSKEKNKNDQSCN
jgi:hypothetical protein